MTSTIKVNNIQNQCGANIINESSNTITIGASGDTIALASGASQTGFGREGSVNWQTGSIKTATFTATSGEGYFCNTSGGAFTVNLPAGSAGAIVAVSDYTRTFQTNNLTVSPNGSEKIGGVAAPAVLETEGQSATFVYVDGTEGWINVQETSNSVAGIPPFIQATGGTITTCGDFKVHTFTGPGTFAVTTAPTPGNNTADYFVVGGGGSGGGNGGGGGGAGGFRLSNDLCMPGPQTSPLANPTGLTITASTNYPITVGAGGAGKCAPPSGSGGNDGNSSTFSTITSAGGGKGGGNNTPPNSNVGGSGGSGGGAGVLNPSHTPPGGPGAGNTPPVSPPQGNAGGTGYSPYAAPYSGGGGGGAGAVGASGAPGIANGGDGSFVVQAGFAGCNGTPGPVSGARYFAGGGGAGRCGPGGSCTAGTGGVGGGSAGINGAGGNATDATANTGGGGGGQGGFNSPSKTGGGGSGIVIIRYKFQ